MWNGTNPRARLIARSEVTQFPVIELFFSLINTQLTVIREGGKVGTTYNRFHVYYIRIISSTVGTVHVHGFVNCVPTPGS